MAFRVWIDTPVALPLGVAIVRRGLANDEIFNLQTSAWVKLPDDGKPLAGQWGKATHYGPVAGPLAGSYYIDLPSVAFVYGAAVLVLQLDGADNVLNRQATYALDPKIGDIKISVSRSL